MVRHYPGFLAEAVALLIGILIFVVAARAEEPLVATVRASEQIAVEDDAQHALVESRAGETPLTREQADAVLDAICFAASEALGQPIAADESAKERWAAKLAAQYGEMSEDQRQAIAQMPENWKRLCTGWRALTEPQRAKRRADW